MELEVQIRGPHPGIELFALGLVERIREMDGKDTDSDYEHSSLGSELNSPLAAEEEYVDYERKWTSAIKKTEGQDAMDV
jgi:hypothetical protein